MNKKCILVASVMVLACACQSKAPAMPAMKDDAQKKEQTTLPQSGCCEMAKPPAKPSVESATPTPAAPQEKQVTATPDIKAETKSP